MKILERLRDLAEGLKIEPRNLDAAYEVIPLDFESIDYEDPYGFEVSGGLPDSGFSRHTVDGLRRRIPEVHEEIPPEGYAISDQNESFDPQ
ncbi:MAG: hypothetical protein Q8L39_00460 [Burkholderiales bacterium]|nr:hypothetical protein [Burkholderiales bacterium]